MLTRFSIYNLTLPGDFLGLANLKKHSSYKSHNPLHYFKNGGRDYLPSAVKCCYSWSRIGSNIIHNYVWSYWN